jgi:ribosome-associated translation inhibitor RaiA
MKVTLSFEGIAPAGQSRLREILSAHVRRLRSRLEAYTPEFAHLEARIDKDPQRQAYRVSLRLKLSRGVLMAEGEGTDLKSVLSAFDQIERRVDEHMATWRRSSQQFRRKAPTPGPHPQRQNPDWRSLS